VAGGPVASHQLGLMPAAGSRTESALAMAQRSAVRVQEEIRQRAVSAGDPSHPVGASGAEGGGRAFEELVREGNPRHFLHIRSLAQRFDYSLDRR
jgi:hypothetical protein